MRVFFDFSDGLPDATGMEFSCLDEAESQAIAGLLAVAQDKQWELQSPFSVEIRDDDGSVLSTASLAVTLTRNP